MMSFQVFAIIEEVNSALDIDFGLTLIFTIGSFIRKNGLINNSGLYIFFQQYRKKTRQILFVVSFCRTTGLNYSAQTRAKSVNQKWRSPQLCQDEQNSTKKSPVCIRLLILSRFAECIYVNSQKMVEHITISDICSTPSAIQSS